MIAVALIVTYALADRYGGGGWPWLDSKLPGRAVLWGALLAALAGWFVAGWPGVVLAVIWGVHRSLPFRLFGGSAAPETREAALGTFARYALLVPLIGVLGHLTGSGAVFSALCTLGFAVAATALAIWYGREVRKARRRGEAIGDQNVAVELIRGAAFGLAAVGVL